MPLLARYRQRGPWLQRTHELPPSVTLHAQPYLEVRALHPLVVDLDRIAPQKYATSVIRAGIFLGENLKSFAQNAGVAAARS